MKGPAATASTIEILANWHTGMHYMMCGVRLGVSDVEGAWVADVLVNGNDLLVQEEFFGRAVYVREVVGHDQRAVEERPHHHLHRLLDSAEASRTRRQHISIRKVAGAVDAVV